MEPAAPAVEASPSVVGASVAGASHPDGECQDAFAVAGRDGTLALAVADGLGSAPASAAGAREAVRAAVRAVSGGDPAEAVVGMCEAARAALERLAEGEERPVADVACTLIAVAGSAEGLAVGHVGDGAVVGLRREGSLILLSAPAPSEYVNEVEPLTSDTWRAAVRVSGPFEDLVAVAAFTDGCARAALAPGGEPHPGFFDPLFAFAGATADAAAASEDLDALLGGAKMGEHSDDDKTLVIAWLRPPS